MKARKYCYSFSLFDDRFIDDCDKIGKNGVLKSAGDIVKEMLRKNAYFEY